MQHLNYYNKDHREIIRLTGRHAIKLDTKADIQELLTTHHFLETELEDIISRLHGHKKWEKKLASILSQVVDTLILLKKYECWASLELQEYILNSIRNYFRLTHSPHLFLN